MAETRIGEAHTDDEQRVEAALLTLAPAGVADAVYERVDAGITNLNWIVRLPAETLFVKIFGAGTHRYIDRRAASDASRVAGELGVGPRLVAYLPQHDAEVFEYLGGYRTITPEEMADPAIFGRLLDAYRTMHQAPLIAQTRTGLMQLAERVALAHEIDAALPDDADALLARCADVGEAVDRIGTSLSVCHNDSYAANVMIDDAGNLRIIDWEYAANNDPAWDLAMLGLTRDAAAMAGMVERYAGAPDDALTSRAVLYGPAILVSWGLWATTQARLSDIGFDSAGYSARLFDFARSKFADPAWEAARCGR